MPHIFESSKIFFDGSFWYIKKCKKETEKRKDAHGKENLFFLPWCASRKGKVSRLVKINPSLQNTFFSSTFFSPIPHIHYSYSTIPKHQILNDSKPKKTFLPTTQKKTTITLTNNQNTWLSSISLTSKKKTRLILFPHQIQTKKTATTT